MPMRNQEAYLDKLPSVHIQRSIFNRPFSHKTSFNVGDLIPFYLDECIPGSSHEVKTSVVCRLQTLLTPIMDQLYLDTFYFFVPFRLLLDHWPQMCGENDKGPWTRDKVQYQIPYLKYPDGGFDQGSIADYFGVPIGVSVDVSNGSENLPSALPFRAYALIVNEFFRSTPLQQPIVVHTDDTIRYGVPVRTTVPDPDPEVLESYPWYITDLELGGKPFVAARFHDYFSSALPQPQMSEPVSIFGGFADPTSAPWLRSGPVAPVITGPVHTQYESGVSYDSYPPKSKLVSTNSSGEFTGNVFESQAQVISGDTNVNVMRLVSSDNQAGFVPANLWTNLNIPEATISTLRLAFQMQKYFERLGSGGQRYREYLSAFFGVDNGDARMQIPEYLGGHRVPLSIHQVANTSESASSNLGDLGAMSNTSDVHFDFHRSFSEWGYVIGLACVRYDNTYSQGLEPLWSRRDILDFYNPTFANISDQPLYGREISLGIGQDSGVDVNRVFGYKPAWQEYRQKFNRCSSEMRPEASGSLASWHLADDYETAPYLSETWIMTDPNIVDRVLAVGHNVANQVFCDFFVQNKTAQPMPLFAIPGLADHF